MARKLASIKTIGSIMPIEGRDRIVLAMVDGWSVIIKKDEFQTGDKCVYVEIDSVMPETEKFEFLRKNKFRIKTMKMAGVISQGIVFPLSVLPEGDYVLDQDVTEILGVTQYEPTMDIERDTEKDNAPKRKYPKWLMRYAWFRKLVLPKKQPKEFPDFISKTDETRIQNAPYHLQNKEPMIVTEKIDGQSGTFFIEKILKDNIRDYDFIAIQGECIAPKVQGNKYKVTEPDLYVFNVIDSAYGRWDSVDAMKWCQRVGMKFVPVLNIAFVLPDSVKELLEYAHGKSAIGDTLREGIVIRSKDGKQSFKAVDPLFLMKYDE